ncbi:hypothetical protein [Bradyrhizobium australiense]|uniref:Uncharacterized protein n=1 Tax=Bradyrhizobium australiense TaxID=2721161 RepID=A0A7Y4GRK4_9BRAD|nr:hypothetical protein [Bradyrhizobium australiense]NOJ40328.1 hypothetical protein [Bradyrhizobium australiense]
MTINELIGPAVVAAVVSGFVTIIGNIFSNRSSRTINTEKIASESNLAERKFEFERELSERRFWYERELHDYRRSVEFAEELLASFYKLKDTIREIRGPFSFGDEGSARNRKEYETEAEARSRDGYYVPIARIHQHKDFLSEVTSKKYRAQAIFRSDIRRAFELMVEVLNAIQIASNMLVQNVGQDRNDHDLWQKLERQIWDVSKPDEPDELSQKVEQAIAIVERAVRPTLERTDKAGAKP